MRQVHAWTANDSFVGAVRSASNANTAQPDGIAQTPGDTAMDRAQTSTRTIDLGYDQLIALHGRPGTRVRVLYGSMWLTEEGVERDVFAGGGDEVALKSRGLSVIEGLGRTRVELIEPVSARWIAPLAGLWSQLRARAAAAH
jgi:hypothetical protein